MDKRKIFLAQCVFYLFVFGFWYFLLGEMNSQLSQTSKLINSAMYVMVFVLSGVIFNTWRQKKSVS